MRNGTQPKLKIFFYCNFVYHLGHCGGDTVFVLSECSQDNSRSNGPIYMKFVYCNFVYHLGHCGGDTVFVLSECSQDNSRSNGPIYMKFGGIVDIPTRANRLDFGATQLNI